MKRCISFGLSSLNSSMIMRSRLAPFADRVEGKFGRAAVVIGGLSQRGSGTGNGYWESAIAAPHSKAFTFRRVRFGTRAIPDSQSLSVETAADYSSGHFWQDDFARLPMTTGR